MNNEYESMEEKSGETPEGSGNQTNADSPPAGPYGLDTISPASYAFFLVRGELNATYARGFVQPAVGVEVWRHEYSTLPVFVEAERIWVVLTDTEDNLAFVTSIAADKSIRRRCVVSTWGVQVVAKYKMLWERQYLYPTLSMDSRRSYDEHFENVHGFQKFPRPSEKYKLRRLGTPKKQINHEAIIARSQIGWWR